MEKSWRVAVASTDGDTINEHFGKTRNFYIFNIGSDGIAVLLEKRAVILVSDVSGHSDSAILEKIDILRDCTAVLAMQIGSGARRLLALNKITVFEETGDIKTALHKLARYFIRTNFTPHPGI